jgi:hypothetical protein
MNSRVLALVCIAALCIILTLGLWPFHSRKNEVTWLSGRNGLRLGRHGTIISSAPLESTGPLDDREASLEIWLQPKRIWDSGTFLAFFNPGNLFQFSLYQSQTDLELRTATVDKQRHSKAAETRIDDIFRGNPRPLFMTITAGAQGACVYLDGTLTKTIPGFPLSGRDFTGRLVLGDSPGQSDSWSGLLLGMAIYRRQLTASQVLHNYATWKREGRPEVAEDERNSALYLFDERTGNVIRDKGPGVDLDIPEQYQVMNKIVLEPFWTEFEMSRSYWMAVLKNIVGFIPFGICFYAYLSALSVRRAVLLTVALGTAVSVTIEILQAFLPTRDSGTTDIITNTFGAWMGVASYRSLHPTIVQFFPWLPVPSTRK